MLKHRAVLELLAVHPDYQRLGAGRGLVTWGTKKADEIGVKVLVSNS
jgi:N-acetylglutamate synthase-like GNAT family acetyltransferase